MGMRSKRKGKVGELELASVLRAEGFQAVRGQQYRGGSSSPDVVCHDLPEVHLEVKRCERLNLYDAVDQAKRDAGEKIPVVCHRRSRREWVAVLPLVEFLAVVRESEFCAAGKES